MPLGSPAITTPNALNLRAVQAAVLAARARIEQLEALLASTSASVSTASNSSTLLLNQLRLAVSQLSARVTVLENAAEIDIVTLIAGETILAGQGVVPLGATTAAAADPSDPTRMFGLLGVALNAAGPGETVQVQRRGLLTLTGTPGFLAGRAVYVDSVGITQNPDYDATALPVGVAVSSTQIVVAPDWPALLYPVYSSDFTDAYLDYLPVTYRALQSLAGLEALINALPFSSGVDADAQVPVIIGGIAVRVTAGDIAALGGGGGGGLSPIANNTLLANTSGGSAVPVSTTLSALLDAALGSTQGQIITRNAGTWTVLNPGTAGYVLQTGGAGADVSWVAPGGGGGGTSKVTKSAVALGTQAANQTAYTYTTIGTTCARGLMSYFLVTASIPGLFDLVIRGDAADSGTLFLSAIGISPSTYLVTLPAYYENDAAGQDFFVGIRNRGPNSVTFTLTSLRIEKFA